MMRDRRLVVGVTITSLVVLPALMGFLGSLNSVTGAADGPVAVLVLEPDPIIAAAVGRVPRAIVIDANDPAVAQLDGYVTVLRDGTQYQIVADRTVQRVWAVAQDIQSALETQRTEVVRASLKARGIDAETLEPFQVRIVDTSSVDARSALVLATLIPYLVIVLLVANSIRALYVAVGEKEKHTLASLLVCTVPRRSIVIGKSLAIMTFAIFASVLLIAGMTLFANFGFSIVGDTGSELAFRLSPGQVAQLLVNIVGLALLISSIIMIMGTFARTQREAGIYTAPLLFVSIFLAVFSFSDSTFALPVYAVPILGNSLAMRETILGTVEWPELLLPLTTNALIFAVLIWSSVQLYKRETVLFRK